MYNWVLLCKKFWRKTKQFIIILIGTTLVENFPGFTEESKVVDYWQCYCDDGLVGVNCLVVSVLIFLLVFF